MSGVPMVMRVGDPIAISRGGYCGLSSRGAISDQDLGKLRKRRCNTRGLAGKPLAGFRATPSRRIPVLCGMTHVQGE